MDTSTSTEDTSQYHYWIHYWHRNKLLICWLILCIIFLIYLDELSQLHTFPTIQQYGGVDVVKATKKATALVAKTTARAPLKAVRYIGRKSARLGAQVTGPSSMSFISNISLMFSKAFYIIGILLLILCGITLPILLVMILTYFTIKHLVTRISSL
jgi:hypothetical protein